RDCSTGRTSFAPSATTPSRPRATRSSAELHAESALAGARDRRGGDRDVPRGQAVRLEDDDVVVGLASAKLAGDDVLQLVNLEPVEHAAFDRLDQIAGFEFRLLAGVAADERRPLEHDVVQLAPAAVIGADRADERARLQPLAAQNRIPGGRRSDDDVGALDRLAMRLGRLGADLLTELLQVPL